MSGYNSLAAFYDLLTGDISYQSRAEYFERLIKRFNPDAKLLLDLACGTGSLSVELAKKGYDVIAVDGSCEMLTELLKKKIELGLDILPLCQNMPELDLYGTIQAAVCALDSLNHITDEKLVKKTVERVALFTEPGGVFVFDVNTQYKHREVLGNNVFVYDYDEVYCVWQNSLDKQTDTVTMELDIFENADGAYYRSSESIAERAYSDEFWRETLTECGFSDIHCFHEDSFDAPRADSQRVVYAAVKK